MVRGVLIRSLVALLVVALLGGAGSASAVAGDVLVSVGSRTTPFSQNRQDGPALAIDPRNPSVVAAAANDWLDMEACNAGPDNDCPRTDFVGVSGVYFSFDSGQSWTQPRYMGETARDCEGEIGPDPGCSATVGLIGTVPNYIEHNLVSDGDPAVAFGPRPTGNSQFSYANGSRLYYASLTSAVPGTTPFRGSEAIAVSHTDEVAAAAAGSNDAWSAPVIASRENSALLADKEQLAADNAQSSPFFGNVYMCYAAFRGTGNGSTNQPLDVLISRDGGDSWTQHQVTPATSNAHSRNGFGRSGCTVRTDSRGVVYVLDFQFGFNPTAAAAGSIQMIRSTDGGAHWQAPVDILTAFDTCNAFELSTQSCVEDGVAGARSDFSPAPSLDIANGAPSGGDASNRLVLSWVDGRDGLDHEHVMFSTSSSGGEVWSRPRSVELAGDRGYATAPAISPNGTDVWLVYDAFIEPFKASASGAANDRPLVGEILRATVSGGGVGAFAPAHRGPLGDARASSRNDLAAESLGEHVHAAATRSYGVALWTAVPAGADCPAVDAFRQDLHDESAAPGIFGPVPPDVQQECPGSFGNSDIFGWSSLAP